MYLLISTNKTVHCSITRQTNSILISVVHATSIARLIWVMNRNHLQCFRLFAIAVSKVTKIGNISLSAAAAAGQITHSRSSETLLSGLVFNVAELIL